MTEDAPGEYTRFRTNIQLGDGPDQRGDMTVEIVRVIDEETPRRETHAVTHEGPIETALTDAHFAEFALEVGRATDLLKNELGLTDEEVSGDA